jgi:hypothetical protein
MHRRTVLALGTTLLAGFPWEWVFGGRKKTPKKPYENPPYTHRNSSAKACTNSSYYLIQVKLGIDHHPSPNHLNHPDHPWLDVGVTDRPDHPDHLGMNYPRLDDCSLLLLSWHGDATNVLQESTAHTALCMFKEQGYTLRAIPTCRSEVPQPVCEHCDPARSQVTPVAYLYSYPACQVPANKSYRADTDFGWREVTGRTGQKTLRESPLRRASK